MADNALIKILTALLKHQVKRTLGEETLGVLGQELAGIGGDKLDAWIGEQATPEQLEQAALNVVRSGCAGLFAGNKIQHMLKLCTNILYNLL